MNWSAYHSSVGTMVAQVIARDTSINLFANATITRLTLQVPEQKLPHPYISSFFKDKSVKFCRGDSARPRLSRTALLLGSRGKK